MESGGRLFEDRLLKISSWHGGYEKNPVRKAMGNDLEPFLHLMHGNLRMASTNHQTFYTMCNGLEKLLFEGWHQIPCFSIKSNSERAASNFSGERRLGLDTIHNKFNAILYKIPFKGGDYYKTMVRISCHPKLECPFSQTRSF